MKFPKNTVSLIIGLLLTACGGGGSEGLVPDCMFCFPAAPPATVTVDAGPDRSVTGGDTVELAGSAVHSRNWTLDRSWSQLTGPPVTIFGSGFVYAEFVAPPVSDVTALTFRFTATTITVDIPKISGYDDVTIYVEPTSASALCLQAPMFAISYAWSNNGCTTDSADIAGDSRIATVYRQGEAEPNDSSQMANPLTFPLPVADERVATDVDGLVSGVGSDYDDFFVFTPSETGLYAIYLCNDPLICTRGTATKDWFLSLSDQDFVAIAGTNGGKVESQRLTVELQAGLPYYVGVHVWHVASRPFEYNLTVISGSN